MSLLSDLLNNADFWHTVNNIGLALSGGLVAGLFALAVECRKSRTARSDRERELLKEIAVKFAISSAQLMSIHIQLAGDAKRLAGRQPSVRPSINANDFVDQGKEISSLIALAGIGGYEEVSKALMHVLQALPKITAVIKKMAECVCDSTDISQSLLDELDNAEQSFYAKTDLVHVALREAFPAIK